MEAPAIFSGLMLAGKQEGQSRGDLIREVATNGSILLLVGAFLIGWATGTDGQAVVAPFFDHIFRGVLCLFLLDMGLVAGRGFRSSRGVLDAPVVLFGLLMPLVGGTLAALCAVIIGLPAGTAALLIILSASASYIAVPAAMRVALPEANPSIYLTLSLGVTFPFNLTLGIPLYIAVASALVG